MRKLKALIQIQAPVKTVKTLTESPKRREWMRVRNSMWLQMVDESWRASEHEGGTRLELEMRYRSKLPFLEPFLSDGVTQALTTSLNRLKQMAESSPV